MTRVMRFFSCGHHTNLVLAGGNELCLECSQTLHARLELVDAPSQLRDDRSRRWRAGYRRLAIRSIKLGEIAGDALVDRRHPPLQPLVREVLLAVVHGLELAAINRDACVVE